MNHGTDATASKKTRKVPINNIRGQMIQMKDNIAMTACAPYTPCRHMGSCCNHDSSDQSLSSCPCVKEFHWCTKFCICAPTNLHSNELRKQASKNLTMVCANFFPGCRCKQGVIYTFHHTLQPEYYVFALHL
jgi:hypothetical protein